MPDVVLDLDGQPTFTTLYRWGSRLEGDRPGAPLDTIGPGLLDCARTAVERIYKHWLQDPEWHRLMGVLSDVFQPIEDAIGAVAWGRYVSTAEGVQLDELAAKIGRPRGGLVDDDVFRLIIVIDTASTITISSVDEIVGLLRRATPSPVWLIQIYPAGFLLQAPGISTDLWLPLVDAISDVPSAGVGATISTFDPLTTGVVSSSFGPEFATGSFGYSTSTAYLESFFGFAAGI